MITREEYGLLAAHVYAIPDRVGVDDADRVARQSGHAMRMQPAGSLRRPGT